MKATKLFDIPPSLTSHHRGAPDRGSEARQQGQIKGIAMQVPISLTDDQLSMIVIAAQPIPPSHRAMFLEAVAARLHGQEVGDGAVSRAVRAAQAEYFTPSTARKHSRSVSRKPSKLMLGDAIE